MHGFDLKKDERKTPKQKQHSDSTRNTPSASLAYTGKTEQTNQLRIL